MALLILMTSFPVMTSSWSVGDPVDWLVRSLPVSEMYGLCGVAGTPWTVHAAQGFKPLKKGAYKK
jgi:hypothetical protein